MTAEQRDARLTALLANAKLYGPLFAIARRTLTKPEFRELMRWGVGESSYLNNAAYRQRIIGKILRDASKSDRLRIARLEGDLEERGRPKAPTRRKAILDDENPWQQVALRCWEEAT